MAGAAPGKDRAHLVGCSGRSRRAFGEIDVVDLPLGRAAGAPPLHAAELQRPRRGGRAVIGIKVGDDLIGLAVAQAAGDAADALESQAVAHRAVAPHLDRRDPYPVRLGPVAVCDFALLAEVIAPGRTALV